jgi:hypothetical protein
VLAQLISTDINVEKLGVIGLFAVAVTAFAREWIHTDKRLKREREVYELRLKRETERADKWEALFLKSRGVVDEGLETTRRAVQVVEKVINANNTGGTGGP